VPDGLTGFKDDVDSAFPEACAGLGYIDSLIPE
jgi:hypothetical protein